MKKITQGASLKKKRRAKDSDSIRDSLYWNEPLYLLKAKCIILECVHHINTLFTTY